MENSFIVDTLTAAKEIIKNQCNWTQYTLARDTDGKRVSPTHKTATRWDIDGAIFKVLGGDLESIELRQWLCLDVYRENGCTSLSQFNDSSSHPEVLSFIDRIIERYKT